jgi:hypothetical protein
MDVKLLETGNGGDLLKLSKDIAMVFGFENMPYLAMFGGNVEASTPVKRLANEQAFDWWGNSLLMPNDSSVQFNSLTERKLLEVPLTSFGRLQIEQAVIRDLEFMKPFAEVRVKVSIIATDKLQIAISIVEPDNLQKKEFIYIWDALKGDVDASEEYVPSPSLPFGFDYTLDFVLA